MRGADATNLWKQVNTHERRLDMLENELADERRLRHETEKAVRHLAGRMTKLYGKLGRGKG